MILYHGSPNQFEEFDYSKIGLNGTNEGKGFYFTDTKRIAEGYAGREGYLYTILWKGKKPLSYTEVTLTVQEFKKYILKLDEKLNYLSNWGEKEFEGVHSLLKKALMGEYKTAESDADMIGGIVNVSGSPEIALKTLHSLLGYDSIVIDSPEWGRGQKIYVALVQDAFEIESVEKIPENYFE